MTTDDIGRRVLEARTARKMSRRQFGELTGLTPTQVGNIEKGRKLKPGELEKLQPHLTAQPEAAGNGEAAPPPPPPPAPQPPQVTPEAGEAVAAVEPTADPVVILTEDEKEEREGGYVGEDVLQVGGGLPTRVPFQLPGYHFTNSELRTWKRCRRKWWLAYYRELRLKVPEVVGPRGLGTRVHIAMASHYSKHREDILEVYESVCDRDRAHVRNHFPDKLDDFEKDVELGRIMLQGYMEWLATTGADQYLEVIAEESVVEVPFPAIDGVVLAGKLDVRVRRHPDNARLFMDHKTVGSLTEPLKTLHMDEQMLHYHLLEFLEFLRQGAAPGDVEHSHGGLYNMLRKVKRTARANPPFYDRVEVRHNIHELRSYYLRVFGEIQDILEVRRKLDEGADPRQVAYPMPTSDCSWDCDFFGICPMFDDGSDAERALDDLYERADPHEHYYPYGEAAHRREEAGT